MTLHPTLSRQAVAAAAIALALAAACSRDAAPRNEIVASSPAGVGATRSGMAVARAPLAAPAPAATEADAAPDATLGDAPSAVPLPVGDSAAASMLVRTGTASVQVDSLELAIARLHDVARRVGGAVADVSVQAGGDQNRSASLELRIPSARFDDAVSGLAPIGKVETVNVSVEDVGEEYVDVAARVANARRLEERLVQLLATRTGKLGDVLQVERELARVREEIERYEGRLRYLRARASVSRLTVTVHEALPLVAASPADHPIRDALKQAWRNFVGVSAALIASLGVLVPLGALALGGWLALRGRLPSRRPAQGE